jgi:hypothetical protein
MLPGASADDAWSRYINHVWHMTWKYSDMEVSATRSAPPPPPPEVTAEGRARLQGRFTIAGSSDEIVSSLLEVRERASMPVEFVARSYFATLDYPDQIELMQQLAEEVAPHL